MVCCILAVLSVGAVAVAGLEPVERPTKPHVVFALIDDLGWADVSYHAQDAIHTPTIDGLAKDGVVLDNYYVQPVCSPTRSALMTGRFPFKTGLQHFDTIIPTSKAALPLDTPTLAEIMNTAGYKSHMVGKWHLGYASWENTPTKRGFASHTGYFQGMIDYYGKNMSVPFGKIRLNGLDWWHNTTSVSDEKGIYNKVLYDAAATAAIDNYTPSKENPLFLYYAHQVAHIPLEIPDKWLANCTGITNSLRHTYCGMLAAVDHSMSQLVASLKAKGIWDDTLLIVSTDNGGMVPYQYAQNGSKAKWTVASAGVNYPLRAGKTTVFQGGVRGFSFINGGKNVIPESARGRVVNGSLTHMVDWMPTLANLAQASVPENVDGHDLWDMLVQDSPLDRQSLPIQINWNITSPTSGIPINGYQVAVVTNDGWKLILNNYSAPMRYDGWFPAPTDSWKYIPPPANPTPFKFLFNIAVDPNEHHNLYSTEPAKVKEIMAMLDEYNKDYILPQTNKPNVAGAPFLHGGVWAPFIKD